MDYKQKYLEEKVKALQLEANLLQVRFGAIQEVLPGAIKELKVYNKEVETNADKKEDKS